MAIDGSESTLNAANYAIRLTKQIDAYMEIVFTVRYSPGSIPVGVFPADVEAKEEENAIQLINIMTGEHPEIKIQDFGTLGGPAEAINKIFQNWHAVILIIGYHAHGLVNLAIPRFFG